MARRRLEPAQYLKGILAGDRMILSRAITLVESALPSDRKLADAVISACLPHTGNSLRVGITGIPGVGKSTFINAFGSFLAAQGLNLAVLAVDPSSTLTRGSILGDKTRMQELSMDPRAYIRPSPTGGSLGGVARKTRESLLLCEAAGYEVIIIETVGVGQSEIAVRDMVDAFLLLLLPHAGDELQGIKKGIMEMADLVVINKADGEFLPKARKAKAAFSQALRLFPHTESGWRVPVLTSSALEGQGMEEIWGQLGDFRTQLQAGPWWDAQRQRQALQWMEDTIQELLNQSFYQHDEMQRPLAEFREAVAKGNRAPIQAAEELMRRWGSLRE